MIVNDALTPPANDMGLAPMSAPTETVLVTQDISDSNIPIAMSSSFY